jgi:hypothetical protein
VEKFCQHIEKLLAQHDYVVVPGLGGFVVQMQSALFLPDHITPPLATIGFNPLMHHADGLLAIEIARTDRISYRLAMEYIDKQVDTLKSGIESAGSVQFGNLGAFYTNELGIMLFSPEVKVGFLPQNFELTNLYVSQKDTQITGTSPKITISFPSTRVFKYASAAVLVIGLLCISPKMNDMRHVDNAGIASSVFYTSPVKLATAVTVREAKKTFVTPASKDSDKFHVIVASLTNQTTADNFCKELVTGNFKTAHVLSPARNFRVAIQSFSDREKAIQYMENLRKTDKRFETAWVYCK